MHLYIFLTSTLRHVISTTLFWHRELLNVFQLQTMRDAVRLIAMGCNASCIKRVPSSCLLVTERQTCKLEGKIMHAIILRNHWSRINRVVLGCRYMTHSIYWLVRPSLRTANYNKNLLTSKIGMWNTSVGDTNIYQAYIFHHRIISKISVQTSHTTKCCVTVFVVKSQIKNSWQTKRYILSPPVAFLTE